jgi:threonine dehydratase
MFSSFKPTDVLAAADRIRPLIKRTPLIRSDWLSGIAGGDVC